MVTPALQMSANDPAFWVLVFVAAMFALIAAALIVLAVAVGRAVRTVQALERPADALFETVGAVREQCKQLVGYTAVTAKEQVGRVSQSVEQANRQFSNTVFFINSKLVRPARELAAILSGVRRGLEVLAAPAPKQIDQTYGEEEMFIG